MQQGVLQKIREQVATVMVGKEEVTKLLLTGLVAGGHILLEDVPGTGKTVLAKTLAKTCGCGFDRVQFTPDLLPSDVTGLSYFNQEKSAFTFKQGPVFTNILLADEINRATPRTQAALLECMAENQVTVDGVTRQLEEPFFVIATQNPVETTGCFPLPEAQLDRFLMKIYMGSLTKEQERQMLDRFLLDEPLKKVEPVATKEEMQIIRQECREVFVHEDLRDYIVTLVQETRKHDSGVSPRGTLAMLRAVQGYAYVEGREYVVPEDIKALAIPVLCHRFISEEDETRKKAFLLQLLQSLPMPTEDWSRR